MASVSHSVGRQALWSTAGAHSRRTQQAFTLRGKRIATMASASWESNLITDDASILKIAASAKRVAVLGIKTLRYTPPHWPWRTPPLTCSPPQPLPVPVVLPPRQAAQPSYFVPEYLQSAGVEVVPVPVFYPEVR